jgi:hypothetical protein
LNNKASPGTQPAPVVIPMIAAGVFILSHTPTNPNENQDINNLK